MHVNFIAAISLFSSFNRVNRGLVENHSSIVERGSIESEIKSTNICKEYGLESNSM